MRVQGKLWAEIYQKKKTKNYDHLDTDLMRTREQRTKNSINLTKKIGIQSREVDLYGGIVVFLEKIMANFKAEFGTSICYYEVKTSLEYGKSDRRTWNKRLASHPPH